MSLAVSVLGSTSSCSGSRVTPDHVLTLDLDWAPDWMIDGVAAPLIERRVKATWFVTHSSPAVDRLRERRELFRLGMHPNCLPGSTQGGSEREVLAHARTLVPEAVCMRTHALYQSTPFLLMAARDFGVRIDVSLALPHTPNLQPHQFDYRGCSLHRIPYFWEDDLEMFRSSPVWSVQHPDLLVPGLKIFDFHPVFLCLNCSDYEVYQRLKRDRPVHNWTLDTCGHAFRKGAGPMSLFLELVDGLAAIGGGRWIEELV